MSEHLIDDLPPLPEPAATFGWHPPPPGYALGKETFTVLHSYRPAYGAKASFYAAEQVRAVVLADRALRGDGRTAVAADLLRSALGPLEVSAAIEDSEDGGESIDTLITCIKLFLDQHDAAAIRSLGGKQ